MGGFGTFRGQMQVWAVHGDGRRNVVETVDLGNLGEALDACRVELGGPVVQQRGLGPPQLVGRPRLETGTHAHKIPSDEEVSALSKSGVLIGKDDLQNGHRDSNARKSSVQGTRIKRNRKTNVLTLLTRHAGLKVAPVLGTRDGSVFQFKHLLHCRQAQLLQCELKTSTQELASARCRRCLHGVLQEQTHESEEPANNTEFTAHNM